MERNLVLDDAEIVRAHYNRSVQREWERLDRHPFEFLITKRFLDRYIRPGDVVLDIGGGPGRYSLYLADKGCRVTLLDLSDGNVAFAKAKADELRLPLRAVCGDVREAGRLLQGPFDHVLLMGPLYHLLEDSSREEAVTAALALLKPGGVLFASFISLYAGLIYGLKYEPQCFVNESEDIYLDCCMKSQTYSGDAFTRACFIEPCEIEPFFERFGLLKLHLFGQESITAQSDTNILACPQPVIDRWTELAVSLCERPEFWSHAEHLMYVGQKIK